MKRAVFTCMIICFVIAGCTLKPKESGNVNKIENTLQSVTFLYDSAGTNPNELLSLFDRVNKVIDSIGYPDAGYKLWIIQGDSSRSYRFMVEGYWPDQATYDTIHNNKLYKNAWSTDAMKVWGQMKTVSYNRFTLVK